ncbi:MAG TPA: hypothetical protein VGQ76_15740, partial [Thermoanaerobaculia bacterium]|nr:hypothetical protein [Thermoanaerobaculia bacterium]
VVGMLLVAGVAWIAASIAVAMQTNSQADAGAASEGMADMLRLGVTVAGWVGVTVYSLVLTSRRAFEGFHTRGVIRLAQFISTFEIFRIAFGPSIVDAVKSDASTGGPPGWLYALAELPLHPYVLAGCVIALPFIVPRVVARQKAVRERTKAAARAG